MSSGFNREEMRRAIKACHGQKLFPGTIEDILDTIESTLKVGEECDCADKTWEQMIGRAHLLTCHFRKEEEKECRCKNLSPRWVHFKGCPAIKKEEECTCPLRSKGHMSDCHFYQDPVKDLPKLPEKPKADFTDTEGAITELQFVTGQLIDYLAALQDNK